MDPWEALIVNDFVLKEFLEWCNVNTTFIPGLARHAQVVLLNKELNETHNTQVFEQHGCCQSCTRFLYQGMDMGRKVHQTPRLACFSLL